MVSIREIPISGNIANDFNRFFQVLNDLEVPLKSLKLDGYKYRVDDSSSCAICGHAIKQRYLIKGDKGQKWELGIVCASNLLAIQNVDGNIDKLNYDRKVALEKKTILKRMKEFEEEQAKIQLEIQKGDIFDFLNSIHSRLVELKPRAFGVFKDEKPEDYPSYCSVLEQKARFFLSVRISMLRGQLTKNQETAIRKQMELGVDSIISKIKSKIEAKERKDDLRRRAMKIVYTYIEECMGTTSQGQWYPKVWKGYHEFLQSIRNQFREKGFLSEKQMNAVEKIHDKICKKEECRQRSWS